MTSEVGVLRAAAGLAVARRGTPRAAGEGLSVGPTGAVSAPATPALESRTLAAVLWRRLWVLPDRLVIDYLGVVSLAVSLTDLVVTFDRDLGPELEQHLLLDHVLPLVLTARGHLVLHGALLSRDDQGVILVGPSGVGKSTLTAYAWQHGWTVGGDDGTVLHPGGVWRCEPTYPSIRLNAASTTLLDLAPPGLDAAGGKVRVLDQGSPFRQAAVRPVLVAALTPGAAGEKASLVPVRGAAAHALLFGTAFHLEMGRGPRLEQTMDALAALVGSVAVARLVVPRGVAGLAAAEALLRAAITAPAAAPR